MAIKIQGTPVIDDSRNLTNIGTIKGISYPAADGSDGQVLATDGSGSLSFQDLPPTAPTVEAVASGTLSDGSPVVVNSDGTVSVVESNSVSEELGTPTTEIATGNGPGQINAVYHSAEGKVVIAYHDDGDSEHGYAIVGDVSGSTVNFGSPTVFIANRVFENSIVYDSAENKVVIVYKDRDTSDYLFAIVGTVSGTTISFGTPVVCYSGNNLTANAIYDPDSGKIVIVYRDGDNSNYPTTIIGTVSGTSISFGTPVVVSSVYGKMPTIVYDSDEKKVVVFYSDIGNNDEGTAKVGTVSGSSITFGSPSVFGSINVDPFYGNAATYDSGAGKVIFTYVEGNNNNRVSAVVGDVNGDSISLGNRIDGISNADDQINTPSLDVTYDSAAKKVIFAYGQANGPGFVSPGTVSGTSITFDAEFTFKSPGGVSETAIVYDPDEQKSVIIFDDDDPENVVTYNPAYIATNLTSENFIGFSNAAYSDTQTATVQVIGSTDDSQSGLTAGQSYFVQGDGTLAETAGNPEVFAGTAVSDTDILVKL